MANVGSNTGSTTNIVKAQRRDERVGLEQERQRLADSSTSTEDSNLRLARGRRREGTGVRDGTESRTSQHDVQRGVGRLPGVDGRI